MSLVIILTIRNMHFFKNFQQPIIHDHDENETIDIHGDELVND